MPDDLALDDLALAPLDSQDFDDQVMEGLALSEQCPDWREALPAIDRLCSQAVAAVLDAVGQPLGGCEISLVLADNKTVQDLNRDYRSIDKPTNVLSFALTDDEPVDIPGPVMLGDIILAFETVQTEASDQGKTLAAHTSHLIAHGILHLLGHDHEDEAQANDMEELEKKILATLGIDDPYSLPQERGVA